MDTAPQPLLTLKPHFDDAQTMVQAGLVTLVAVPFITVLGSGVLIFLLWLLGISKFVAAGYVIGLVLVAVIVIFPPAFYEMKKKSCARSYFDFYENELQYRYMKFHLMERRGAVAYGDIMDITQESSTMQEQRRLCSILLHIPSMRMNRRPFAGLVIADQLKSRDDISAVMDIVGSSNRRAAESEERAAFEQQQAAIRAAAAEMIAEAARQQKQAADNGG